VVRAYRHSKAFTLIELIFAIVIISIVFLALPTISRTNADAVESSVHQEAIFAASAELSKVLTFRWDENSKLFNAATGKLSDENVVDINTSTLTRINATTPYRIGHIRTAPVSANHRQFHNKVTDVNSSTHDNDILSKAHNWKSLFTATASSAIAKGYKKNYNLSITINDANDAVTTTYAFAKGTAATAGATNMKVIQVNIDIPDSSGATDGTADIILRSYAANIGEVALFKWN